MVIDDVCTVHNKASYRMRIYEYTHELVCINNPDGYLRVIIGQCLQTINLTSCLGKEYPSTNRPTRIFQ